MLYILKIVMDPQRGFIFLDYIYRYLVYAFVLKTLLNININTILDEKWLFFQNKK